MKRQKAKGKRQKAKIAEPVTSPPPVSQPLDAGSPQEREKPIDAATRADSAAAVVAKDSPTLQKSSTLYNRAMQLLTQRGAWMVATIAAVLSIVSFVYFFTNGMTNHY